jgi:hypothetical protein
MSEGRSKQSARVAALALCLVLAAHPTGAAAWTGEQPGAVPPTMRAMAGAGAAVMAGTGALFANPALMAVLPGQSFELSFARDQRPGRSSFSLGSVDGNPGSIAGGSVYSYETGALADGRDRSGYDWRAGAATGVKGETAGLFFGGSVRRQSFDIGAADGVAARSVANWCGDAGILIVLGDHVRVGGAWRNIGSSDDDEAPSRVVGGVGIGGSSFAIAADADWSTQTWQPRLMVGGQLLLGQVVLLRGGWRLDNAATSRHLVTTGAGVRIDRWGIDASFAFDPRASARWQLGVSVVLGLPYVGG